MPGDGFEPPKRSAADLQSAPFGHSGNPARCRSKPTLTQTDTRWEHAPPSIDEDYSIAVRAVSTHSATWLARRRPDSVDKRKALLGMMADVSSLIKSGGGTGPEKPQQPPRLADRAGAKSGQRTLRDKGHRRSRNVIQPLLCMQKGLYSWRRAR